MITLAAILLAVAFAGACAHPRTRHLFVVEAEPKLIESGDSVSLTEWKEIFRETVIAAEGKLTAEMEAWLANDVFVNKSKRQLLSGKLFEEYRADNKASCTSEECFKVDKRWHEKKFRFSLELRKELLRESNNEHTRNSYRAMFDEQDKPE